MDDHDITAFANALDDAAPFVGRNTAEASVAGVLLAHRRAGGVQGWMHAAVAALAHGMALDWTPQVARAILQTPNAVWIEEADDCAATSWFVERLRARAAGAADVWVALGLPDSLPLGIPLQVWTPTIVPEDVMVHHLHWFVEVRGRGLGLQRGKLLRTGLHPLIGDGTLGLTLTEAPDVMRLGRRVLRGHPVRR